MDIGQSSWGRIIVICLPFPFEFSVLSFRQMFKLKIHSRFGSRYASWKIQSALPYNLEKAHCLPIQEWIFVEKETVMLSCVTSGAW